ncbi:FtsX-like permease family protein [Streptomyces sp. WAC06614]|uniref:FtsX-like permease family protein n=1 Tax=Streptomyces sp. WAC06614 TaxID=2487416 RepID=UPI000F78533B|nr:FtsX-like permease family protein [Streptomyces sp. WAC06614]RSS80798.1 FtsX-like permease family protein [Streptomyces sp. WAC06614]
MGVGFAVNGGRAGWFRTLLTGAGVALGVALMLVTAAVPNALAERDARATARGTATAASATTAPAGPNTLLVGNADTIFRSAHIYGRVLQPEGTRAPLPPGLKEFPRPGELAVSPALKELLASPGGRLLRERLTGRISATIGAEGLVGPRELAFYQGSDRLVPGGQVQRVTAFTNPAESRPLDPTLMLLLVVAVTGLLVPVATFTATAVRFGGERRDRRLAALRLVGADRATTRWIAAGEGLAGALLGLVLGAGVFLVLRRFADDVTLMSSGVYPDDLDPAPWLLALVALVVPTASVALTLFAMRSVAVEPLGVFRTGRSQRRRLWWRLLLPLAGLGLLVPLAGRGNSAGEFDEAQVIGGVFLLLVGVTALLPWLVEAVMGRLGGGGVSWLLAVRRLQANSGTAVRLVNGIAVAVAAAVALHMLFTGTEARYTRSTGQDPSRAALSASILPGPDSAARAEQLARQLSATPGVAAVASLVDAQLALTPQQTAGSSGGAAPTQAPQSTTSLTVGTCAALREIAELPSCTDGDTFVLRDGAGAAATRSEPPAPGTEFFSVPEAGSPAARQPVKWTLPRSARPADARPDPLGSVAGGVLATPGAVPPGLGKDAYATVFVQLDRTVPDALDRARTVLFRADPVMLSFTLQATVRTQQYAAIRTGTSVGVVLVLLLAGAGLLVAQLEQLRERRKVLSALASFGTPRSVLGLSALWETAVPVAWGTALAGGIGVALGAVLMAAVDVPVVVDWAFVGATAGVGAGVVLLVTALTLPPLLRLTRPDHLRTE